MNFVVENWTVIATALFAVSEVLALIPSIKANSLFQIVTGFLKKKSEEPKKP